MDFVLILMSYYTVATAEFYTLAACEDAGKTYMAHRAPRDPDADYICKPKAQARPQHQQ
jgi:hypothetical protein